MYIRDKTWFTNLSEKNEKKRWMMMYSYYKKPTSFVPKTTIIGIYWLQQGVSIKSLYIKRGKVSVRM